MDARDFLLVFLASMAPSFEGRYALLLGVKLGMTPLASLMVASIGVSLTAIALSLAIARLDSLARRLPWAWARGLYEKIVLRARGKARPYLKYGFPGLVAFVAIPLPGTGVWTGALVAFLFGLPLRMSLPALLVGGLLSNLITFSLYLSTKQLAG